MLRAIPFRTAASASRPPRPSITTTPHILERTVRGLQRTRVTALLEPGSEIGVVVDFAIVDDPHRPILVGHRLTASEYVHDREPAHPQPYRSPDPQPLAVGPPVAQDVPHALETCFVHGFPPVQLDDPHDPAHALTPDFVRHGCRVALGTRDVPSAGAKLWSTRNTRCSAIATLAHRETGPPALSGQ